MTYGELLAAIATWLSRSDQAANIPLFIRNAEARINRELRVREMIGRATAAVDQAFADLPSDFLAPRSAQIGNRVLGYLMPDDLLDVCAGGLTAYYTVLGSEMQFASPPTANETVQLTYYRRLTPVSESATNWLLVNHPDAYLYGALCEAAFLARDEGLMAMAEARFQEAKRMIERGSNAMAGDRLTPLASTVV
jgi:hypothetical protein